ncbi:MAG: hypothetical protein KDJ90_00275 [Nitratireductor sp.]|nr:hypothetical protein [Nitratireductor sp.]
MTRDSIVEKMAANAFASERVPWERMHPADKEDAIEAANDCLTALEQSIPGLSGVIDGGNTIVPTEILAGVHEIAVRNEAAAVIDAAKVYLNRAMIAAGETAR